jgi:hypothetical protein
MEYSTPELVVLGPAAVLVQGKPEREGDSANPDEEPAVGLLLGLDD